MTSKYLERPPRTREQALADIERYNRRAINLVEETMMRPKIKTRCLECGAEIEVTEFDDNGDITLLPPLHCPSCNPGE